MVRSEPLIKPRPSYFSQLQEVVRSICLLASFRGGQPLILIVNAVDYDCKQLKTQESMAAGAAGLANVMNQSLSPTKLNPSNPLSPSNYPDKKSVVAAYKRMVRYRVDFRILVLYGSLMSIKESFKMANGTHI